MLRALLDRWVGRQVQAIFTAAMVQAQRDARKKRRETPQTFRRTGLI